MHCAGSARVPRRTAHLQLIALQAREFRAEINRCEYLGLAALILRRRCRSPSGRLLPECCACDERRRHESRHAEDCDVVEPAHRTPPQMNHHILTMRARSESVAPKGILRPNPARATSPS